MEEPNTHADRWIFGRIHLRRSLLARWTPLKMIELHCQLWVATNRLSWKCNKTNAWIKLPNIARNRLEFHFLYLRKIKFNILLGSNVSKLSLWCLKIVLIKSNLTVTLFDNNSKCMSPSASISYLIRGILSN